MSCVKIVFLCLVFCSGFARANDFAPEKIILRMKAAADWQLGHPFGYDPLLWHCAPFYMGLIDLTEVSGDPAYANAVKEIGKKHEWTLAKRIYHADDQAVGQSYLKLYQREHDPKMIEQLKKRFDFILAHPAPSAYKVEKKKKNKTIMIRNTDRWVWCDALYMAPAAWAGLWKVTGDEKYLDFMVKEWKQTTTWLWDEDESLYYRDMRYIGKKTASGAKIFWSRGDGWVFGGLVEVLEYLPKKHPYRPFFEDKFKRMAKTIQRIQKPNGTWAPSLLDPKEFPQDETSGTAFFTYGLAWGINNGLLDKTTYESTARKGWKALCERQQPDGRLINVQPVGSHPKGFDPNSTVIYGMGAFLCAGSEMYKLVGGNNAK